MASPLLTDAEENRVLWEAIYKKGASPRVSILQAQNAKTLRWEAGRLHELALRYLDDRHSVEAMAFDLEADRLERLAKEASDAKS